MSDVDIDVDVGAGPRGAFRVLASVEQRLTDTELADLKRRVGQALQYFPALTSETVTVACRRDPEGDHNNWNPYASADPVNRLIRVPTHERTTNVTLFHELAHLAIEIEAADGADYPTSSEEFCSLYAIARQPPDLIDEPRIPYLGEPEPARDRWPELAEDALAYREHNHAYIQQAKQWFGTRGETDG